MAKQVSEPSVKYKEVLYAANKLSETILAVEKDGQKLKYKIHNVALSIITCWGKKQVEGAKAAEYFTALGKAAGYHGKPLANWIKMKTPLKYSEESKAWYCPPDATVNGDTFKAARNEPFWEVSPPPEPKPFDAMALLEALLSKNSTKAANKDKVKEGDKLLPNNLVADIRRLIDDAKLAAQSEPEH